MSTSTNRTSNRLRSSRAVLLGLLFALAACGGGGDGEESASREANDPVETTAASGWVEPDYDGVPTDLTSDEVCALIDEATVAELLGTEVTSVRPGGTLTDCTWMYKLEGGPATNLQVQVLTMDQTEERLGTEALEWGLDRAPEGSVISQIDALDVPNGTYEFGSSTLVFAVGPQGRVFTVAAHSDTPEESRIAIVEAVLEALAEQHG